MIKVARKKLGRVECPAISTPSRWDTLSLNGNIFPENTAGVDPEASELLSSAQAAKNCHPIKKQELARNSRYIFHRPPLVSDCSIQLPLPAEGPLFGLRQTWGRFLRPFLGMDNAN